MPFKVGDRVVYPHHGAAVIEKKEMIEFGGEKREYKSQGISFRVSLLGMDQTFS